mmetsp:Transcript_21427/g.58869  ORF Transcript_21427/g.58869 Transcript_21427/m.58869 type:complete len:186 (+) Transcript_21427:3-560(+)
MGNHGNFVMPGDLICKRSATSEMGAGTYILDDSIYSSLIGFVNVDGKHVSVSRKCARDLCPVVPTVNSIVLAKITSINARMARAQVLSVGTESVMEPFPAIIRAQDIRIENSDTLQVSKCFRPGDVIRAAVISLGDSRSFYLSTARAELGVVYASSEGMPMVVVDAERMRCQKSKVVQPRKVAIS